jgi:dTDP-glucose 4,6-dehydratase
MKYLVTGGAGFIGSNFIHYILNKYPDRQVVNLDKLTYAGNLDNLKLWESDPRYRFVKGDINDRKLVSELVSACDIIVHFAAESHVDRSISNPAEFVITNVLGTQTLLDAAVEYKKRLHHISTDEVFGSLELGSENKFNEKTPYDPSSPYSSSKAASDHLVRAYMRTYGLSATISNCSNNFGPYQFPEKLISLAITNLLEGKKVPVYGKGNQVRDWLHVEDHCAAIDLIIEQGKAGETYCIGGMQKDVTNLEVVRKIIALLGKSEDEIEFVKDRPGHDVRYAVDWSKINVELGWSPKHGFDEWLAKTVEWYDKNTDWWKKLKNVQYKQFYSKQYGKTE